MKGIYLISLKLRVDAYWKTLRVGTYCRHLEKNL